jgi:hypothetical protein
MPVSQVSICNSAIFKVGGRRISSITEETKEAQVCNGLYEQLRDQVLRDHPWNFASKRATLTPTADEPAFEFDYEFDIPSDCLRILKTYPDDIDFVVEGDKILTNETELDVQYIYRHEDESDWPADFAEAFAWKLASELAYPLMQSLPLMEYCNRRYKEALAEARSIDGMEGIIRDFEADVWTRERRG